MQEISVTMPEVGQFFMTLTTEQVEIYKNSKSKKMSIEFDSDGNGNFSQSKIKVWTV